MMGMDYIRLESIKPGCEARHDRELEGEIAAIEFLDRRHALDDFRRPGWQCLAFELRRDHEHAVLPPAKFFRKRTHGTSHSTDVRQVGVGHHANVHSLWGGTSGL